MKKGVAGHLEDLLTNCSVVLYLYPTFRPLLVISHSSYVTDPLFMSTLSTFTNLGITSD